MSKEITNEQLYTAFLGTKNELLKIIRITKHELLNTLNETRSEVLSAIQDNRKEIHANGELIQENRKEILANGELIQENHMQIQSNREVILENTSRHDELMEFLRDHMVTQEEFRTEVTSIRNDMGRMEYRLNDRIDRIKTDLKADLRETYSVLTSDIKHIVLKNQLIA
ncbi:MAG: hypothetical protein O3B96_02335 [bacterium]|nr:hypothetical protein [bacterium]